MPHRQRRRLLVAPAEQWLQRVRARDALARVDGAEHRQKIVERDLTVAVRIEECDEGAHLEGRHAIRVHFSKQALDLTHLDVCRLTRACA